MPKTLKLFATLISLALVSACGGGGGVSGGSTQSTNVGQFIDAPVGGMSYTCSSSNGSTTTTTGTTNSQGQFNYVSGQSCTFTIGNVTIGTISNIPTDSVVTPQDVAGVARSATSSPAVTTIAQFLQSLDDGTTNGVITIPSSVTTALSSSSVNQVTLSSSTTGVVSQTVLTNLVQSAGKTLVSANVAASALQQQINSGAVNVSKGSVSNSASATLTSIAVTAAAPSVAVGTVDQLTAMGYFSDGTSQDITSSVNWSSSNTGLATVGNNGQVSAAAQGTVTVTANLSGKSAIVAVQVTPAVLQSLTISPSSPSVAEGRTINLTATGHYSDGSNNSNLTGLSWSSGSSAVASVDANGVVTAGSSTGSTTIAVAQGGISASAVTLSVTSPTLTSIVISSASNAVQVGSTLALNALGNFSNSTQQTLTTLVNWVVSAASGSSGNATIVNSTGVLTGVSAGNVAIQATYLGLTSNQQNVSITTPPQTSIVINSTNTVYNTAVGDLNGDGLDDVVVGGWNYDSSTSYVWVLIQNSDGTLSDQTQTLLSSNVTYGGQHIFIADFDNDGKKDILIPGFQDGSVMLPTNSVIFWNNGSSFSKQIMSEQVMAHGACLDDINGDGKIDFLAAGNNGASVLFVNNGNRTFTANTSLLSGHWFTTCGVIHQANGDVNILLGNDAFQLNTFNSIIAIYDQQLNFKSYVGIPSSTGEDLINSGVFDANGDGLKDFVLAFSNIFPAPPSRRVLINNGNDSYSSGQNLDALGSEYFTQQLTLNGSPALLLPAQANGRIYYVNNGVMVAYKPSAFSDFAGSNQVLTSAAYQNPTLGKTYILELQSDGLVTKFVTKEL